jgi:hypothetical protein
MTAQQSTHFDALLVQCRDLACGRLSASLAVMLDQADASLADLAVKAQGQVERKLYFAAKDVTTSQREVIEKQFKLRYLGDFQQRTNQVKKIGESFSDIDLSSIQLEIVGDDDLNETLKFNDMGARLYRYCVEELGALDQRVGVLLGDAGLQSESNPFSPMAICSAYKQACRSATSDVAMRMILLKLFDDHVLDDVRSIYKEVNELLVQNEILPKIRYVVTRSEGGKAPGPAENPSAVLTGESDFFAVLQKMMAQGAAAIGGGVGGGGGGGPILQGADLLSSLTRIQLGDVSGISGAEALLAAGGGSGGGATNVLHELKTTSVGAAMAQMDAMTLDIVALLFDQLFDDPKIPVALKGLIARLQIPMLKVAIADKSFFSKKDHPARQVLDALGEIAVRLPTDFGPSSSLYPRIETFMQDLEKGFQEQIEIFDTVRERLEALIAEDDEQVAVKLQSTATALNQAESLALARSVGRAEIKARVLSAMPPRAVLEFLAQHWIKYLVVVHVRHGVESETWKNALGTIDQLVWSVAHKVTTEERRMLASVVPALLKAVKAGLTVAGAEDAVSFAFFKELMRCHRAAIRVAPPKAASAIEAKLPAVTGVKTVSGADTKAGTGANVKAAAGAIAKPVAQPAAPLAGNVARGTDVSASTTGTKGAERAAPGGVRGARAPGAAQPRVTEPLPVPGSTDDLDFVAPIVVKNPFGEGKVMVDDLDFTSVPGAPSAGTIAAQRPTIELPRSFVQGTWVEILEPGGTGQPVQAKLHYVSPLQSHFLFVDRKGNKVYECSRAMLAMRLKIAEIKVLDGLPDLPLFEQMMSGVLKKVGKLIPG